ncbi:MAG: hypothetical protein QM642_05155 [Edaphocola sp.]
MQAQERYKQLLPHLLIIGIFIVISCGFAYPAFQGKTLDQHDAKTWIWGSKESRDYHAATGENALWANNMFGGMPQVQVDAYPVNNWYHTLINTLTFYKHGEPYNPAIFFLVAMVCFYILANALRANKWIGLIGAVAFAFSTYNPTIVTAGHATKMLDVAYIPAIMAGIILAYRGKYWQGAALAGLFTAFSLDAGHLQIIFYSIFLYAAMAIGALVNALRKKEIKVFFIGSAALLAAVVFACLCNASRLMQTQEYVPYSTRGGSSELTINKKEKSNGLDRDYAFAWSNGVGEVLTILVPDLYGGSTKENIGEDSHFGEALSTLGASPTDIERMTARAPLYWGPQPMISGSIYFGAVICFLSVLALTTIKSKYKWWLFGASVFILLVSMGKNLPSLNYFLFDHFPGFSKFRSPNMAPAIASAVFPLLAIWALKDIFEDKITKEELFKKSKLSVIITGGLCAVLLVASFAIFDYKGDNDARMEQGYGQAGPTLVKALREDRQAAATHDALRSLLFVLLAGGALFAYSKDKINKTVSMAAFGALTMVDILPVAHRWLNQNDFMDSEEYFAENFSPRPADAQIMQDKDPYYRVFDLTTDPFNDSKPSYFHKALGGYQGAKMQNYQDLIEMQLGKMNSAVINMLNTKYFIFPTQNGQGAAAQPNPGALGNAWFVNQVQWVKTADEEMLALNAPTINNPMDSTAGKFNPATTAVMRDKYKADFGSAAIGKDSGAYVRLAAGGYSPRRLKFESSNSVEGLAVFSDIYYPIGWTATIDGKKATILNANYVLRALKLPAGKHTIEFQFGSAAFEKGKTLALIGSILLTLLIAAAVYFSYFRKKEATLA